MILKRDKCKVGVEKKDEYENAIMVSKKDNNKKLATTFYFTKNVYLCTLNK